MDWSHILISFKGELIHWAGKAKSMWPIVGRLPLKAKWWDAPLGLQDFSRSNTLWYLCRHLFLTYSLVYITEPVFLPFLLNARSAQRVKKKNLEIRIQSWEHYAMVLQSYKAVYYFSSDLRCNCGEDNIWNEMSLRML